MKPTPIPRPHWLVVGVIFTGTAALLWGCGHTREILYPRRKVSPPVVVPSRIPRSPLQPVEPAAPATPPRGPTTVDVPILDQDGAPGGISRPRTSQP